MSFNVATEKEWVYWTHTCTVIEGCTPVSEGCVHCWAKAMAHRFKRDFSKITVHLDRLERVAKGKKRKVISLWNDVYHEDVSFQQHMAIFEVIQQNQQHTFLILTKRPSRMVIPVDTFYPSRTPYLDYPANTWIGTTVENQEQDKRISKLFKCRTVNRFLSLEPLLGPVDLDGCLPSWVIVGCETGPYRRPCDPEWIRSIVQQCRAADVPCFVKAVNIEGKVLKDWNKPAFPDDLKVREFPGGFDGR